MTGLYLHVPFCEKKCSYCDFYSIESVRLRPQFVKGLMKELRMRVQSLGSVPTITSVFFGGGTPSLLLPEELAEIVAGIREELNIADDAEWTMECNPGTVDAEKLSLYRAQGINRLSFGVQSFTESELRFLDRIHSADDAVLAMQAAREAGFTNVNMDLMFAVPGQTFESLAYNIRSLLALQPEHISAYSLIYEAGTPLYTRLKKGEVRPTSEDTDAEMYAQVIAMLAEAGYGQYEVSNFAKPGKECRHNLTYWHAEDYLAVGPSAHGRMFGTRTWNVRSLAGWLHKLKDDELPHANLEILTHREQLEELAFLSLRADGMEVRRFMEEYGVDLRDALQPDLGYWMDAGMVVLHDGILRLTGEGYRVCDEITLKVMSKLENAVLVHADGFGHHEARSTVGRR